MAQFCCRGMHDAIEHACAEHPNVEDCPDHQIRYIPKFDEYGIINHDGGTSSSSIFFCPWCGAQLPDSKRDRWFEELAAIGVDPGRDDIPEPYRTEEWFSRKST